VITNKFARLAASVAVLYLLCGNTRAQDSVSVDRMMSSVKTTAGDAQGISIVRETALRESAAVYGAREGLREKSCLIRVEIERQRESLDKRFRFADLTMGSGVLPPVISEARDSVSLENTVMRVASRVYHLDENARIVDIAPTWRDWLFVGLSGDSCTTSTTDAPTHAQLKPQTPQEEAFYRSVLTRSYAMGTQQAKDVLADNVARLERSYQGMRRYFDLYQRGMVSAPVISSSTDILSREDPNTLVVGNTVIRIMVPVDFVEKHDKWKPLSK
jgi:defect in organelle trafficking protein DotC